MNVISSENFNNIAAGEHRLHPTTLFASIKIANFHTLASHQSMIEALGYFLFDNLATNKLEGIDIRIIQKLTELFFEHNLFYYQRKIYGFTRGGPNSAPFSETLVNICVFLWQRTLFNDVSLKSELRGRYKDQIFFTWNRSEHDLRTLLNTIVEKHPAIRLKTSIGRCVHYLNIHIENRNGQLFTRIYHPEKRRSLALPFVIGHARVQHGYWFRSALIRAVQLCSYYEDFEQERIYMEMSCLANGYSISFIEHELQQFYRYFNAEKIRFSMDEMVYNKLRGRLFNFIEVQRSTFAKHLELEDHERLLRFYYLYDYGPRNEFQDKFREIWYNFMKNHTQLSLKDIHICLTTKTLFSLNTLLAKQKPTCPLLRTLKN